MFEVGDKVEAELFGSPWTGTVTKVEGTIVWVDSDISDLVTWFTAKTLKKIEEN